MKRLLCLLLLCSWNAAVWSQGPPLVKNGGFEMADENGFPLHWQPVQGERPVQFEAELVPRSTEKGSCLSLEVATNAPWTMQGTVEGALRENQSYLFSCEAMTEEWSGIIQINLYREGGTLQDRIATLSLTRTDDWRPLTATVRVSRQTQPIVRIEGERGCKIRLDNIAISPLLYGRQPEAPNAPRAYRVTDLSRRVGILLQAEDLLEEGPEWTEEGQENSDQWVLTSIDFFADLWMEGQVLRSPKNSRPETLLSLRIAHLLPGKYWLFLSDPGGALEARWNGGEWKRLQGGKGEARWGHVELGETPVLFEVRTPPAGEDTALPCYLDYLRLLPDFQQADRIVAKQPSISPPLRDPVPLQGQLAGKAPFLPVPLRVGVPLPMGGVRDAAALSLKTDKATLPSQAEVFSRWPDESPRWSMVRTVVPPDLWTKSGVDLDFKASDTQAGEPYRVKEKDGLIKVVGGGLEMALDGTTGEMVRLGMDKDGNGEVDAKENLLASPGYLRVEMPTTKSALTNVFLPRLDSHEIESEGSLYLRVKCQGVLSSFVLEHELNYCLRWECYAGIPGFRYELFLWSEEDENTLSVWDVSWVFPLSRGDSLRYCFPTDSNHFVNGEVRSGEGVTLLQKNYHEYEIQASTEAFQETFHSGQSHPGWASFGCDSGYLVVQTDHFREMHPSSFELGEAGASVGFLPSELAFEDPTKWFDGTGRTCSGWILLLDREKPRDLKRWFEAATQWPVLTPTAEWVEG